MTTSRFDLVLLAALSRTKPPSERDLATDVQRMALPDQTVGAVRARVAATLTDLRARGLVAPQGRALTAAGRDAVREAFALPAAPSWQSVKLQHAPALGLGLVPGTAQAQRALASGPALHAALLSRQLGVGPFTDVRALCEHLLFERLQLPAVAVKDARLLAHVLAHRAGVEAKGALDKLAARLAASAVGARNGSKLKLREALARRWAASESQPARAPVADPPALDGERFRAAVRGALGRVPADGRFGEQKVYIDALWDALDADLRPSGMDLPQFKRWLLDANARQLVVLARADLVSAMDPARVAASEIVDRGASFHFVLDDR